MTYQMVERTAVTPANCRHPYYQVGVRCSTERYTDWYYPARAMSRKLERDRERARSEAIELTATGAVKWQPWRWL